MGYSSSIIYFTLIISFNLICYRNFRRDNYFYLFSFFFAISPLLFFIGFYLRSSGLIEIKYAELFIESIASGRDVFGTFRAYGALLLPASFVSESWYEFNVLNIVLYINIVCILALNGWRSISLLLCFTSVFYFSLTVLRDMFMATCLLYIYMSYIYTHRYLRVCLIFVFSILLIVSRPEFFPILLLAYSIKNVRMNLSDLSRYLPLGLAMSIPILSLIPGLLGIGSVEGLSNFIEARYDRTAEVSASHIGGGALFSKPIIERIFIQSWSVLVGPWLTDIKLATMVYGIESLIISYIVIKLMVRNTVISNGARFALYSAIIYLIVNIPFATNYGNLFRLKMIFVPVLIYIYFNKKEGYGYSNS